MVYVNPRCGSQDGSQDIIETCSAITILSPQQHGFVPGKSCMSQLITAMDHWRQAYNSGYKTDIVYFDFSKAFDTVPHLCLLHELEA